MAKKWKTKRGFVKIHFLIEADTQRVLGLKVTDETVGDPTAFRDLFDDVLKMLGPVPEAHGPGDRGKGEDRGDQGSCQG